MQDIDIAWKLIGGSALVGKEVQEICPYCLTSSQGFCNKSSSFTDTEDVYAKPGYDMMKNIPERHEKFWNSLELDDSFKMPGMISLMHTHYIIMRAIRNNVTFIEAAKMGGNFQTIYIQENLRKN